MTTVSGSRHNVSLLAVVVAAALMPAAFPPSAHAGTLTVRVMTFPAYQVFTYRAASGEENQVELTGTVDRFVIADRGAPVLLGAGTEGCTRSPTGESSCPRGLHDGIDVFLGDRDDGLVATGSATERGPYGTTVAGEEGDDSVSGGGADESIGGGPGSDRIDGRVGSDLIRGGAAGDRLRGGGGRDQLHGDAGRDALRGDAGNDTLEGGSGQDDLAGGSAST